MRTTLVTAALAAFALAPLAAQAEGPSYDYIEAGYLAFNLDDGPTVDGFGAAASFGVTRHFHVLATVAEVSKSPVTATSGGLAIGWNYPIAKGTDVVARAGWEYGRAKLSGFGSDTDNGWSAELGVRSKLTEQFELAGFAKHVDIFDGDEQVFTVQGTYYVTRNFGLNGALSFSDDATGWQAGLRYAF